MVINHDVSLKRTCGVDKDITEVNFDQLPRLLEEYEPYGRKQFMKTEKNRIPLLEEMFNLFPNTLINIELKTPTS